MSRNYWLFVVALAVAGCGGPSDNDESPNGSGGGGNGGQTGGTSSGGASTGGASSGGASTGGASTGGASTGGASTGGASTGGASTGGAPGIKSHPGHYIAMLPNDGNAEVLDVLRPGVKGVQIRYRWRSLEPTKGNYDLSKLGADLDLVASKGAFLIAMIEDKSFDGTKPAPDYLSAETVPNKPGGYTVVRWDPTVRVRYQALMKAIGAAFDDHPGLEAVALQETAPSLTDAQYTATNYTAELYRDSLIELLTTMAGALPSSQVFWYMNFIPQGQSYIASVASAVAPLGVSMGGPDILPESASLVSNVYPFYDQFAGKMTLFCSAQFDSYEHVKKSTGAFYTPQEIFAFARDDLHVSYVLWNHKTWDTPAGSYNWLDALPVIANNQTFN